MGPSGIQLGLSSSCLFKTTLLAVLWPSPALIGSVWGSHRHAQLVDILARRGGRCQFSCCRTAGSLKVSEPKMLFHASARYFLLQTAQKEEEKSALNICEVDTTLSSANPLCLFSFLPLCRLQCSHWLVLRGVCVAEAWPVWPYFLFLSSRC